MAQYKYAGVSLDQKGIRILVQRAFRAEATWATRELRKHIMREHVGSGGKRSNPVSVLKRVLDQLKLAGVIVHVKKGIWRSSASGNTDSSDTAVAVEPPAEVTPAAAPTLSIEKEIGRGSESVYVYYFPDARALAKLRKQKTWPCKIGYSATDAGARVLAYSTALHQLPTVALVIRTENGRAVEKLIHAHLELQGAKIEGSPGTEWLMTSPAVVEKIYKKHVS